MSATPGTFEQILSMLQASDGWTVREGIDAAADLGDPRLVPDLVRVAMADHFEADPYKLYVTYNKAVCNSAVLALRSIFKKHGFTQRDEDLIRVATGGPAGHEPAVTDERASSLLSYLRPWTQRVLEAMAADPAPRIRCRAVLACEGGKRLSPVRFLDDPAADVRLAAIRELPWQPDDEVQRRLGGLLDDPDHDVRVAAARKLCNTYTGAMALIVERLDDAAPGLRQLVAQVMPHLSDPKVARAAFTRLLAEPDETVRMALLEYPHFHRYIPDSASGFVDLLARSSSDAEARAVQACLERLGVAAVEPVAESLAGFPVGRRTYAVHVLKTAGDRRALPALEAEFYKPENRAIAGAIESAVIALGGSAMLPETFLATLDYHLSQCPRPHQVAFAAMLAERWLAVIGEDSFYNARSGASVRSILDEVWDRACGREIDPDRVRAFDGDLSEIAAYVDDDRYGASQEYRTLHLVGGATICCARDADVATVVDMARVSIEMAAFARVGGDLAEGRLLGHLLERLRTIPSMDAQVAQALRREFLT